VLLQAKPMDIVTMAQWAGACATTAAVFVALFKDQALRWWYSPKLVANIGAERPFCVRTPGKEKQEGKPEWQGWRYFIRLSVQNTGRSRAEKVEVFLSRVRIQQDDGSLKDMQEVIPMNLRWSYTNYSDPEIYADGISPDMFKLCDLGAISDPKTPSLQRLGTTDTRLALWLEALTPAEDWLPPGRYEFEIMIAASNCRPVTQHIRLHLTGRWDDDPAVMLAHGFRFD
jgi:hypothetical protein